MAQINKRTSSTGKVSWRARIRVQGYPERSKTFPTKTAAKEWAATIESDLARGVELVTKEARTKTVAQMIDRYIEHYLPIKDHNKDAAKTKMLLTWWKDKIGAYALANVTSAAITEIRDELRAGITRRHTRRSPQTVNGYLAALSHCFKMAVKEWHWLNRSPMDNVGRYSGGKGRVRWLDDDERERLLEACRKSRNKHLYAQVILALSTGARRGELTELRWKQVDRKRGTILLEDTKNGERRTLHLIAPILDELNRLAKVRNLKSDLVFQRASDPTKPTDTRSAFLYAVKAADIRDFRFHDLRHSAASYMAMNGASPSEIAAVLGHKTLQMVKRYSHISDEHSKQVVTDTMNKVFGDG